MSRLYPKGNGHISLDNGSRRVWSSDGRPVNLLPQANWLSPAVSILFPDFVKRNAYAFDIGSGGLGTTTACASFSTILPGEWGPSAASPRTLANIVLGTVPVGVNFIDVRVNIARTKNPTNKLTTVVPNMVPGAETHLPGGSCLCEDMNIWKRIFEIVLVGAD